VLEHPVRIGFLKLAREYETLSPAEALEQLQESDLLLSKVTYHARVLDHYGLVEGTGQPNPDRGVPFRVTPQGEFALAALGYTPREERD
jgi:hypothetical protein